MITFFLGSVFGIVLHACMDRLRSEPIHNGDRFITKGGRTFVVLDLDHDTGSLFRRVKIRFGDGVVEGLATPRWIRRQQRVTLAQIEAHREEREEIARLRAL